MDKFKLESKIFALFLFSFLLILVSLWVTQALFFTGMFEYIRNRHLDNAAALIEKNISSPDLPIVLDNLAGNRKIFVVPTADFQPSPDTIFLSKDFISDGGDAVAFTLYTAVAPSSAALPALRANICIAAIIVLPIAFILAGIIARSSFFKPPQAVPVSQPVVMDAAQQEFIANISHDLRAPLALIHSYAEMMHDFPSEITPDHALTIMNETIHLTAVVNEILEFSSLDSESSKLNISYFNLTQSINDVVVRMSELVRRDGYILRYEHDGDAYVSADESKIIRVFYNLLTNAIKYSGTDKTVLVRQSISNGCAKIEVADKGIGIAPESLPYVWNRYYKENKKLKYHINSTGLGLSIAKKFIDLHGGQCGVVSELGKGSAFWFSIETCNKIACCGNNTS